MRSLSTPVMLIACVSLVALQMSGLHMHVNAQGYSGSPQGAHVHDAHDHGTIAISDSTALVDDTSGHEHAGGRGHTSDTDVSIVKVSTGISKLLLDLIAVGFVLLMVLRPADKIALRTSVLRPEGRHERWRPPLRAPPLFSYSPSP